LGILSLAFYGVQNDIPCPAAVAEAQYLKKVEKVKAEKAAAKK